jgi:hypothetical protein
MRRALSLRELEAAVATLEECALRSDIHAIREHLQHFFLLFFRSRTRVIRATLTATVRDFATLAGACFFYEVRAFKYNKARRAVEANLADQIGVIHGLIVTLLLAALSFNFFHSMIWNL